MKDYLKLLKFVRPYIGRFSIATVCMAFSALFDGVSLAMLVPLTDKVLTNKRIIIPTKLPPPLSSLVDKVNNIEPAALLNYMAIGILALFFLKGLFGFLQAYLMSDIGQKVVRDIKARLYAKIQTLSLDYFTHKRGGELISRITNDVKLVENAVSYGSTDLISLFSSPKSDDKIDAAILTFMRIIIIIYFSQTALAGIITDKFGFKKRIQNSECALPIHKLTTQTNHV